MLYVKTRRFLTILVSIYRHFNTIERRKMLKEDSIYKAYGVTETSNFNVLKIY